MHLKEEMKKTFCDSNQYQKTSLLIHSLIDFSLSPIPIIQCKHKTYYPRNITRETAKWLTLIFKVQIQLRFLQRKRFQFTDLTSIKLQ